MSDIFESYEKKRPFLVCVDSDGCAMDTMDIKHFRCYGPEMIREWDLEESAEPVQENWNHVNLYSMTRGVNRFKGLLAALEDADGKYGHIDGLAELEEWVESSPELSNRAIEAQLQKQDSAILSKALEWSKAVNESISRLPHEENKPFNGVGEALACAHQFADVAIVSSANREAVVEEWTRFGLIESTDILCTQEAGTKAACIAELLKKGYEPNRVLMVGDAPGDLDAAQTNGVLFYPILVRNEDKSWKDFTDTVLQEFIHGEYAGKNETEQIEAFRENLTS